MYTSRIDQSLITFLLFLCVVVDFGNVHVVCVCVQAYLEVEPEALNAIARLALERKTGARGLRAILVSDLVVCVCIFDHRHFSLCVCRMALVISLYEFI